MKHKALYVTTALSLILAIACASLYLKMRACQQECRSLSQEKAYKALLVSYDDFAKARKINQPTRDPWRSYAQDIRNYDVRLVKDREKVKIRFSLIMRPGQEVLGGSAEYVVDIDALKIDSKIFSM